VAELAGQHRHAAARLDGAELGVVPGDNHLGAGPGGMADDGGQVGHRGGAGLVQDEQRVRAEAGRAACLPLAGQVAEELGGVLCHRDACFEHDIAPGARCRYPVHLPHTGRAPGIADADGGVGLAGPGRADDQLGSARAGQRQERGRGLVQAKPAPRDPIGRERVRAQQRLQLRKVRAEQLRRVVARQTRRAFGLRVGKQLLLQRELRAGGVHLASVRPVDALTVRAAQAVGDARPFGGIQAAYLLPCLSSDRPGGELFQELPGVLLIPADRVVGQMLGDAVHQVCAGPRGA
jgi:hypothetical protein